VSFDWRAGWARIVRWYASHKPWERYLILGVTIAVGLYALDVILIEPVLGYRQRLADEITEKQEQLERGARFIRAGSSLEAERKEIKHHLEQAKAKLLPAEDPTLAAAWLQERVNALATEKSITVQSTQVMRAENVDPFRKVAVRLTVSGELRPLVEMLAALEYGPQLLGVPFVELNRRGAIPGAKGPRTITGTVEVSGYLLASAKDHAPEGIEGAPEVEPPPALDGEPSPPLDEAVPPADKAAPLVDLPGPPLEPSGPVLRPNEEPGPPAAPPAPPPSEAPGPGTAAPPPPSEAPKPEAAAPPPLPDGAAPRAPDAEKAAPPESESEHSAPAVPDGEKPSPPAPALPEAS
jgi:hypothetical protein